MLQSINFIYCILIFYASFKIIYETENLICEQFRKEGFVEVNRARLKYFWIVRIESIMTGNI